MFYVCTNPKCVAKKKSAFTRNKRAHGQAKKNAEAAAIREAVKATSELDKPRMKVIVLAQFNGYHTREYYGGGGWESPTTWWRNKLKLPGEPVQSDRVAAVVTALDSMSEEDIAKLIIEFMFYTLRWNGDVERYKIQTTEPLNWLGIGVTTEAKGIRAKMAAEAKEGGDNELGRTDTECEITRGT